jgi:hypothetical protein
MDARGRAEPHCFWRSLFQAHYGSCSRPLPSHFTFVSLPSSRNKNCVPRYSISWIRYALVTTVRDLCDLLALEYRACTAARLLHVGEASARMHEARALCHLDLAPQLWHVSRVGEVRRNLRQIAQAEASDAQPCRATTPVRCSPTPHYGCRNHDVVEGGAASSAGPGTRSAIPLGHPQRSAAGTARPGRAELRGHAGEPYVLNRVAPSFSMRQARSLAQIRRSLLQRVQPVQIKVAAGAPHTSYQTPQPDCWTS